MSGEGTQDLTKPRHYRDLLIWQRSMVLAKLVYQLTAHFDADERFGLVSSMRRTAVAIPTSIAKGQARYETRDFLQQLSYVDGSLAELETQLLLSVELEFCKAARVEDLLKEIDELQRMVNAIARKLRSNSPLTTHHSPLSSSEEKDPYTEK
jgi:carbamoyl-phosphate synthase large subunit